MFCFVTEQFIVPDQKLLSGLVVHSIFRYLLNDYITVFTDG